MSHNSVVQKSRLACLGSLHRVSWGWSLPISHMSLLEGSGKDWLLSSFTLLAKFIPCSGRTEIPISLLAAYQRSLLAPQGWPYSLTPGLFHCQSYQQHITSFSHSESLWLPFPPSAGESSLLLKRPVWLVEGHGLGSLSKVNYAHITGLWLWYLLVAPGSGDDGRTSLRATWEVVTDTVPSALHLIIHHLHRNPKK